jgi:hypothetical protein
MEASWNGWPAIGLIESLLARKPIERGLQTYG